MFQLLQSNVHQQTHAELPPHASKKLPWSFLRWLALFSMLRLSEQTAILHTANTTTQSLLKSMYVGANYCLHTYGGVMMSCFKCIPMNMPQLCGEIHQTLFLRDTGSRSETTAQALSGGSTPMLQSGTCPSYADIIRGPSTGTRLATSEDLVHSSQPKHKRHPPENYSHPVLH